ncbi:MAG TPA: hypothetical protein VGB99_04465 [Acidobacteriota bacterium]
MTENLGILKPVRDGRHYRLLRRCVERKPNNRLHEIADARIVLDEVMCAMIGIRLGRFEITAKLREGGMGEVYCVTDGKLKREIAIKVLPAPCGE